MNPITINNNDNTNTINVNTNEMNNANAMNPHGVDQSMIFDSWMFEKQNVDIDNLDLNNINSYMNTNNINESSKDNINNQDLNNFSTENDSSSWFEPLENILSSTSSSSINSPTELMNFDSTNFNDSNKNFNDTIFNNDTNMTTTTSNFNDSNDQQDINSNNNNNNDNVTATKNEMPPLLLNSSKLKSQSKVSTSKPIKKRLTKHQKEAHNKIEKRYRININTKIAKLQQIIPWVASEDTAFETTAASNNSTNDNLSGSIKPAARLNKSMILEKAVDYILYLQNNERLFEMEVMRLKNELEVVKQNSTKTN